VGEDKEASLGDKEALQKTHKDFFVKVFGHSEFQGNF